MTFDSKVSRRDFLKFLAAGATTLAFGSVLGFSSFFAVNKNGRSGIGGSAGGGIPQAAAQSAPGTFVLGPNTVNISIHAANLTNGKIFYAAGSGFSSDYQTGPFHWNTFDPESGSITSHTVDKDIFCMGQALLANGKVLCAGGTLEYDVGDNPDGMWKGLDAAYEYNPSSNSLQEVQSMHHGRWYPYCIVLEDGKVLTIGGWDEWGAKNRLAEIYDPDSKSWSIKYDPVAQPSLDYDTTYCVGKGNPLTPPGQPCYGQTGQAALSNLSLYPRALLMPTGFVAVAGQSKTTKTWNPQTGELKFAGELARERNYGNMVMLPLNNDPTETGQLLACGGSKGAEYVADTVAEILTPKPPNYNSFGFQIIAPCNFARRHAPNAYLPDGKLIFFGGTDYQNSMTSGSNMTPPPFPVPQSWIGAHLNAEIFDPVAKNWTVVNGMTVPKIYHCTGILLTDGRVWLAGSQYAKSDWELQSEFYVPSYYNATRPTISDEPMVGGYGGFINIPTPDAANIEKVSLIALSTFTHGFSSQMRFIWLQIRSKGSSSVTVSAPVNGKIAPPGYYMIHILDSAGVPSKAKIIKIPGTAPPPPDTFVPTVGITSPSDGATITGPSSGVTVAVAGTASDESGGSGIQKVEVQVGSNNPFKLATATGPGGSGDWSSWSASDVVTSTGSTTILARATDNAGNTKDSTIHATVAFTGSGTYTSIYSQAGTNSTIPLNTGGNHRAGEIMTSASVLMGNSVKRVSVKLKKAGNPTGMITVLVRKGTGDSPAITFGTIDAATLTTADQTFTLESPTSHTFAANDKVLVEWDGTGTNTDQVLVKRHFYSDPAASFDGINTKQTTKTAVVSSGYGSHNSYDIAGEWFKFDAPPPDTTAPTIAITSPSDGATITGPSSGVTVAVTGTASDESGGSGIQKVEVQVGSNNPFKLATATGPGGSGDWSSWSASDVVTSSGSTAVIARATDNAGNTKDTEITMNVTFTGSGTYTTIYSQAGTNHYMVLNSGGSHRAGEIMTSSSVLIGNSIKKLTVKLKKAGNPTGTITVRVRKGTADSDGIIFGTIQATTLTTTDQTFTLEAPTSHTFAANDKVLVEWAGTGTSTDQVLVKRHYYPDPAASFDGINTRQAHKVATSIGYNGHNNYDIAGEWFKFEESSSGDTTAPTVDITSPADAATISGPSSGVTVAVTGTASDESGGSGFQKVEVQVGSNNPFKLATATGPGGSGDWSSWSASDVVTSAGSTTIIGRATDNAGNTKDDTINVTVSFTGSGTYTTIYTQTGTNHYMVLNTGGNHRAGEIMTSSSVLIGNSIKKLTVKLKKAGNPTGTITVRVRKGTADSDGIIFGTIQATTLTTTDQTFTLEAPTSHTFAANDKVLVEWAGTGTSTDQVLVKRHYYPDPAASFDGINTRQAHKVATSLGYNRPQQL